MASFVEELWSSVFTPGPTPTLLLATNVTFAALQFVFFALLLATYSLHFVALSIISAGLWYSINWFAHEVRLAQAAQDAEKRAEADAADGRKKESGHDSADSNADSETETESIARGKTERLATATDMGKASARLQPPELGSRKRTSTGGDSSGYGSTDSEWEKVDGNKA
ncbi:hypothetical protein N7532_003214 [Penicillium argentinense]|uniref:ER membrane protein n=1 Tax=Penicillium argentinense TaxID=1131581 RepID=A0A9W9FM19_9EURO|nr:uncharacterized protein N7532_003214 [Penicillium argentinense]KAJ5102685.1 hypothetical protein N7532_003214 [Penicillium argentinense]